MIRLVATDLDGTLVRSDGSISARSVEAITRAEAMGVDVVFVTGRPLRWAREVFGHVGAHAEAIVANGALLWDVAADLPTLVRGIEPATVLQIADTLRETVPGSTFALETQAGIRLEDAYVERYPVPPDARRGPLGDLVDGPTLKILARHESLGPQEFWDVARECVGHLAEITWSSVGALLEMSAYGVTKASTLAVVAEQRGIAAEEVVAFGDMPNDLPMLSWAGTSYAMANAHPTVREAADHLAPTNDEDGVAVVLEGLLTR